MLSWVIQTTVLSVTLIFLVHYLINFFKSTLTVPKIKDLVNSPTQKYQNMYNIIQQGENSNYSNQSQQSNQDYTLIDLLPKLDQSTQQQTQTQPSPAGNMKSELKNFLKSQLHTEDNLGTTYH